MKQILKVVPLSGVEAAKIAECEKNVGVSCGVYQGRLREYQAAVEGLKQRYDPEYSKNSKQSIHKYSAIVKDGCIVIGLE